MTITAIVLAAGAGTRMRSERPKPLHRICGRPMVLHVIHSLERVRPARTAVVVGHGAELVTKKVLELAPDWSNVTFAEQFHQAGTGDATARGLAAIGGDDYADDAHVIVLPGDTPLLTAESVDALLAAHIANQDAATLLTSRLADPTGYGRIVRHRGKDGTDGRVLRVVEQRDATPDELAIDEVCTSIYVFRRDLLGPALRNLTTDNSQGELYLTDVVAVLAGMGHRVGTVDAPDTETQGVNDRWQLALAERELRSRTNRRWLLNGVTMVDPRQTFIDVTVMLGRDITIYPGTILQGDTVVGDGTDLGPHTQLDSCAVGAGCAVRQTVGHEAEIGDRAVVGPFAHLGPGSAVPAGATTGPFYTAPTHI
jgi:bifunctional UDP-N-acetylglucosamine pyrophosphorylase/glucosamine-1-phosphate N-acetyltransferase